jgi:predicted ATPase
MKVVIAGGSGSGKTETIVELFRRGYVVIGEASRLLLKSGKYPDFPHGGSDIRLKFQSDLAKMQNKREKIFETFDEIVFFDRGLVDVHAFSHFLGVLEKIPSEEFNHTRYDKVFILEQLETYEKDGIRWETKEERDAIHKLTVEAYKIFNYEPIIVPSMSVKGRVDFILSSISGQQGQK